MESAIDKHLKCPRTLSRRVPDEYQPPFPMWVGRADEQLEQVVMGYLGVQYRGHLRCLSIADSMGGSLVFFGTRLSVQRFDGRGWLAVGATSRRRSTRVPSSNR